MKRKLLWFALVLSVLCVTQTMPGVYACYKEAHLISTGDGDMIIETGENVVIWILINVTNNWEDPWNNVVVTDNLAAELEIDSINYVSKGTVNTYTTGKSQKVHLTWNIGTLAPGEIALLNFTVSTDLNPAGKQEYTSPGLYELNSGAVLKLTKVDGKQYSEEMDSIWIEVQQG